MRRLPSSLVVGGLALLAGCAAGPTFEPPAPPPVTGYTPGALLDRTATAGPTEPAQRFNAGASVDVEWWTLFRSPELDALEKEALASNSDLKSAQAALKSLEELFRAQRAARLPDVQLAASAQAARTPDSLAPIVGSNAQDYALYNVGLNISYVFDVFGGVKRATEAAAAQAENQRHLTAGVYLTLTTNVAAAAIQLASLNTQLDSAKTIVEADQRTLDILRRQQRLGEASTLDVANAESTLEQAGQLAPPLQKQIDQQRDLLATLVGRPPSQIPLSNLRLTNFTLPTDLPVSLPSDLVRQRPDVKAAEANIHVASAQVGVAAAARLPSFLITAGPGITSTNISGLFTPGNAFYSFTGGLTQPLFDGGALKHRKRSADALLKQAQAQYRGVVLAALQNTADALQAIVDDSANLQHAAATKIAASRALDLSRSELARGQTGSLPVLTAEAADGQVTITLIQARAARYADTVALYQALGRSGRTLSGQTVEGFWNSVRHARPFAVGFNCALGADLMRPHVAELSRLADTLVAAYPNAGLPNAFGEYDEEPYQTAAMLEEWAASGLVNILGGCCGTTPEHIRAIAKAVEGKPPRVIPERPKAMRLSGLEAFELA